MSESREGGGKCVPQVNSHTSQDDDRPVRSNVLERVNGWKRRLELLIDEHQMPDHGRCSDGYDERNNTQSYAAPQRYRTDDCAPHEVTLMHLTEQCEHQQPWRGDCN